MKIEVGTRVMRVSDRSRWLDGRLASSAIRYGTVTAVVYDEFKNRCSEVHWDEGQTQLCDNRDLRSVR